MSLKNISLFFPAFFVLTILFCSLVFAQDSNTNSKKEMLVNISVGGTNAKPTGVNCFDYYTFGSVAFDYPHAEKSTYKPGDIVNIVTTIINNNSYPVIQGDVIAQIYKSNLKSGNDQGSYLLDEFTAFDGLNLSAGGRYPLSIEWRVPKNAPSGEYYVALFFQEMHSYNLAGLPFLNNSYGGMASFHVESSKTEQPFYIDRNAVLLNGKWQMLRTFSKSFEPGTKITYTVPVVNTLDSPITISVEYKLYSWDQSKEENLLKRYTKKEALTIPANSSKNASITLRT